MILVCCFGTRELFRVEENLDWGESTSTICLNKIINYPNRTTRAKFKKIERKEKDGHATGQRSSGVQANQPYQRLHAGYAERGPNLLYTDGSIGLGLLAERLCI